MRLVPAAAVLGALALVGGAAAAPVPPAPSPAGCLRAWNAPANAGTRQRLAGYSTWQASLSGGVVSSVVWRRGTPARSTSSAACLLELARTADRIFVTGAWVNGGVARWSFGSVVSSESAPPLRANVRILADGRLGSR